MKKISTKNRLKVFVGVSGGVDSSVSAALLKEQGFGVVGVFIKAWYPDWFSCTWREDRRDAMRVCAKLSIPFITFDFEKEYKKEVIDYMVAEYKKGRTPNPDVMCNRMIKFGAFLKKAKKMGADFVATGHYARIRREDGFFQDGHKGESLHKLSFKSILRLLESKDKNKDQTYFLWTLTQKKLKNIIFPIGGLEKPEVRKLAKKFGLITADKKDSQGLCFVGKVSVSGFLKRYIKEKKGKVLDESGNIVGTHSGVTFLTIGQRHGFEITEKNTERKPYYVVRKDIKKNIIVVSNKKKEKESFQKEILISQVSWVNSEPDFTKAYSARIRYRQPLEKCQLKKAGKGQINVIFKKPQRAVSPGQSLVIYSKGACLGGGIIA